ncbi:MAG: glycosyltransferase family 87 protein, partial [Actinomycetota bacterium]|nr:glycosyltransferase family 87 protein [Actinomycetota bacterium]
MTDQHKLVRANDGEGEAPSPDRGAWRLQVYPLAIIVALALAVILGAVAAGGSSAPAESLGGDYPAFYGAGQIASAGDWDNLYELDRQAEAQAGLHATTDGAVARFYAYPPQVAAAYQPLAGLDYHWSYLLHTMIMALFLWGAVLLVRPMIPWLRGYVGLAVAAALLFWPMFRAVTGGSNTALTVFLIAAAWRLVHEDQQLGAGLVLAGLLYKPQFAVPMIGLFLLGRYWRVVSGAAVGAVVFYVSGAVLQGWNWGVDWIEVAAD